MITSFAMHTYEATTRVSMQFWVTDRVRLCGDIISSFKIRTQTRTIFYYVTFARQEVSVSKYIITIHILIILIFLNELSQSVLF